ncbi:MULTISPECIES: DUF302 domain-containing protein [unclassified Phenylobacterium]|jgi:uncharacterized protein (DUF302 family)|uniref:DUF302 domain-containing protein n=1 Tax=unclassified Phenylobacterium TaxID=2640670 RepID=UPI00083B461B|nr:MULTISPECIES: DUF302 domain-containing protein [unclassified Phenylobacterium]
MTRFTHHSIRAIAMGVSLSLAAVAIAAVAEPAAASETAQGVVRVPSAYGFDDTVSRIKADIAGKGIRFFTEIDQADLAKGADIPLRPSKLLIFGNPPLGAQFLTSNPYAGLDWPVRILVTQDAGGKVWVAYTDFAWIADRYEIRDRAAQIKMASEVAGSIAGSVAGR